ncbi:MAG: amino acid adenylation domain-containing protein [Acidobacteriota bacterium]
MTESRSSSKATSEATAGATSGATAVARREASSEVDLAGLSAEQKRALVQRLLAAKAAASGTASAVSPTGSPGDGLRPAGFSDAPSVSVAPSAAVAESEAELSYAQRRLWFLEQLEPGSAAYNSYTTVEARGGLRFRALQRSLDALVRRHESLRTYFLAREGRPRQVVEPPRPCSLPLVDLSGLGASQAEAVALQLAGAEARRPFDLAATPLLRMLVLRFSAQTHWLLQSMHHIISDGWSVRVLIRELGLFYAAALEGRSLDDALPELPIHLADYAEWQREVLEGGVGERQLSYWQRQLEGVPVLEMPADRPRPAVRSVRGKTLVRALEGVDGAQVATFSQRHGASSFMTCLTVWALLLARQSRCWDVPVGSPVANRDRLELESLIGPLINTLVLRLRLRGEMSFEAALDSVRRTCLEAYEHQEVPFELLVDRLGVERDLAHLPLAQVVFRYEPAEVAPLRIQGLTMEPVTTENDTAKFDLTLTLGEKEEGRDGGLWASLEFSTDLFETATAEALLSRYERLLAAACASPQTPVQQLPMLTASERQELLARQPGEAQIVAGAVLPLRFEAIARAQPEAVALRMPAVGASEGSESWTYADLALRASAVARWLAEAGVGPESRVGLCLPCSPELVAALVGILGAGGAYVPLDPAYPQQRLRYLVEDSAIQVVVSTASLVRELDLPPSLRVVEVPPLVRDRGGSATAPRSETLSPEPLPSEPLFPAALSLTPDHLAYVIYTSGSTGRPKGVLIPHGQVGRLLEVSQPLFCFGPGDAWTLFHSFAFDFSVWEIWGALGFGGRLVVVPESTTRDPAAFYRLLALEGVTVLNQTPSAFVGLIRADSAAEPEQRGSLALRWVIFGGEALEAQTLSPWVEHHGLESPALVNMYGITETTVHVTFSQVTPEEVRGEESTSLGSALGDLSLRVVEAPVDGSGPGLDAGLSCDLAPQGVVGELWVGGAGLARGYHGRPALTAQRFVPDPFGRDPGARAYRSGDGARWVRRSGSAEAPFALAYEGRLDHQLKVRGYRIEAGEVESALASDAEVSAAVVTSRRVNREGVADVRLAAYVVSKESAETLVPRLRASLADRLPAPLVPQDWVVLESLPLTAHGKVDRSRLPAPAAAAAGPSSSFVAPSGDVEQRVASIFSQVLGVESVGSEDSFFDLGGHSLLLVELQAQLETAFGRKVEMLDLFRYPTVAHLAEFLGEASPGEEA